MPMALLRAVSDTTLALTCELDRGPMANSELESKKVAA
jgi:hypothetical protein